MRAFLLILFVTLFTAPNLTAQLYDNRARYLKTPYEYDRFDRNNYQPSKPAKRSFTPRSSRSSYSRYRKTVNKYSRSFLTTREFYRDFRSPYVHDIYNDFSGENSYLGIGGSGEKKGIKFKFQCFCYIPLDIPLLRDFFGDIPSYLKNRRNEAIQQQEEEYLKEMRARVHYPSSVFKHVQRQFFVLFAKKNSVWKENGSEQSYDHHIKMSLQNLKYNALRFDKAFEHRIAVSTVVNKLKNIKSIHNANLNKYFGDLKIGGELVKNIPKKNYYMYDFKTSMLIQGNKWGLSLYDQKDLYLRLQKSPDDFYNYVADVYVKQYEDQRDLIKRFALQSAYLVHDIHDGFRPPKAAIPPAGFMYQVPYNYDAIKNYFKNKSFKEPNKLMSFKKAKAIVAIEQLPKNIKNVIKGNEEIKDGTIKYLENAIPKTIELNTIKEAIGSLNTGSFQWSELSYFRHWNFQQNTNPDVIMEIKLKKRVAPNLFYDDGIDGEMVYDSGIAWKEYYMHEGIGALLKKMYPTPSYKEGATLRHFLKTKGLNVPSSLSNHDLGKLFDFGGGNSNKLTIEFSDYAKKYITNFRHGDGVYGTSLFTDLVKLKKLYDILKGRPVDFDEESYFKNNPEEWIVYDEDPGDKIDLDNYLNCFNNPPSSATFKFTIYIDQPIPNKDDTWTNDGTLFNPDINVGHTFISLEMKNGGNVTSQIIGFYPSTGVSPSSPQVAGTWIDDGNHSYDVSVSIDLNRNQFTNLVRQLRNYGTPTYNLNSLNCTDVAIQLANSLGMNLPDTRGSWIGGGGSNPGNLGQDVRDLNNSNLAINANGGKAGLSQGTCN